MTIDTHSLNVEYPRTKHLTSKFYLDSLDSPRRLAGILPFLMAGKHDKTLIGNNIAEVCRRLYLLFNIW